MFKPYQFIKCPCTSKPLRIVSVVSCESVNGSDFAGWFNLHIIDSEGNTDIVTHTPTNPAQLFPADQAVDIFTLEEFARSRGFKMGSAVFDKYIKYPKRLAAYYTLQADAMHFSGTYESIMNELSNIPKGVF